VKEVRLFGDAFDECNEWNSAWHFLSKLAERKCSSLRFLFTSRPAQYIRNAVDSLHIPSIDLTCSETNEDIRKYVVESLASDPRFLRVSSEGKCLVEDSLISRARGMYVIPPRARQSYLMCQTGFAG
jgi:hypothetical protein